MVSGQETVKKENKVTSKKTGILPLIIGLGMYLFIIICDHYNLFESLRWIGIWIALASQVLIIMGIVQLVAFGGKEGHAVRKRVLAIIFTFLYFILNALILQYLPQ